MHDPSGRDVDLISTLSHELRTPLQAIVGFCELGLAHAGRPAQDTALFTEIHASAGRMLRLVNDLLDASRLGAEALDLEVAELRPLIASVASELRPLIDDKQLALTLALGDEPLPGRVEPERLQQVVRNLLANAIRLSPPGAAVTLAAERVDGEIRITLRDHGPGIPPAELETIFDPFVRSSRTRAERAGTGLGLAICRQIVRAHGGRIHASNADGGGAQFHVALPAVHGSDASLPSS